MDYIVLKVRYETPIFKKGTETRAQRNLRFGHDVPSYDPPEAGQHILTWFSQLSRFRTPTESGLEPIKPRDIKDWMDLTGTNMNRYDIQAIFALDTAYISAMAQAREQALAEMNKRAQ